MAQPNTANSRSGVRVVAGLMLVVVVVGTLGLGLWRHVREHVLAGQHYQIHTEHITISQPPEWIRPHPGNESSAERIKTEVLHGLQENGKLSLLDTDLTVRLAEAFSAHPWVARVERVSKRFPSGVEVVLEYRVPVALVELHDGSGVLPVDEHAVLLPTRDFTIDEAERYPRIAEIFTAPPSVVGTRWGDAAVLGAAQIAAAIGNEWKTLNLARVVPIERKPARSGYEYTYRLFTHSGTTVDWGRAPGTDLPGEVPATEKLAQLKRYYVQNNGTLDGADGPHGIEIDERGALLRKLRPDIAPLPTEEQAPVQSTGHRRPWSNSLKLEEEPD